MALFSSLNSFPVYCNSLSLFAKLVQSFKISRISVILILLLIVGTGNLCGQTVGDYGTKDTSGALTNWSTSGNWIICVTNGTWAGATTAVAVPTGSKNVWIRAGSNYLMNGNPGACNNLTITGTLTQNNNNRILNVSGNLTINGGTISGSGNTITLNVTGTFTVPAGTTASIQRVILAVSGSSNIAGIANFEISASGTKTFTGLVTINSGGTWNNLINEDITFNGGINNSGTFNAGTGNHIFITNNQSLTGTLDIPTVTVTGVTLTNNNTLTVGTALSGSGGLTQAASSTLNIGGTSGITTLTATNTGNTVNFSGGGQTIKSTNYYHLTLSGSGTDILQNGTTAIGGNFVMSGSVTTTAVTPLTIGGNFDLESNNFFTNGAYTHNVGGNWINNGWGATFTPGTGTINFTGNSSTISGTNSTQNFNNIVISKTAGQAITFGGASTILTVGGTFTQTSGNFNAPATTTVTGDLTLTTGTFTAGTNFTASGNWINNGGTFNGGTGTVTLNGSGKYIQGSTSTTFNNLTIGNAANILLGTDQTVNGTLTMSNGLLRIGAYNLILGASSPAVAASSFYGTNMIVADGTGQVRKIFTSGATSYTFPIGDSGSNYSPVTLNFVSGTYAGGAYAGVRVTNAKHPNNASVNNYLTRYWTISQSGISAFSCTITGSYIYGNDVVGSEALQTASEYTGSLPWLTYSSLGSNTLTAAGVTTFGDFTGNETISVSTSAISGTTFCPGSTISVPYTILGTYTSGNVFTAQLSSSTGSFASPVTIGTLTSTTAGTISATIPGGTTLGTGYRIRVVSSTPAITGTNNGTDLSVTTIPAAPSTNGAFICIGTVSGTTLSASGAVSGQKYVWYSAASGGTTLKTGTDYTDNTYTTPVIGATTSYWVTIINAGGCESPRTQVTATYPGLSGEDQTLTGTDSWISHIYDGSNNAVAYNGIFTNYFGHSTEIESFDESFGGDTNCFPFTSSSNAESIYTESFSVRFRMNSTKKGLWIVDMGSDDGNRLTVDGVLIYNDWTGHGVNNNLRVLMNLTGNSSLIYDYFENGGGNRIYYKNITQILSNNLSTNISQNINTGNAGVTISGDTYGVLPSGITLSGTGYQWVYSTTPGGTTTNITGATGATFTPNTSTAPFNTPGIYYLYRNAVLSSTNNVAPNPYVATNTSNAATITIIGTPIINTSVSTLSGFTYVSGSGPSTERSFTVSGSYLTTNIIVTPPADFEISTGTGSSFVPVNLITLNVLNSNVATTTIYVRMKAGLLSTPLDLPENIILTSTGTTTQNVACSGSVIIQPVIITSTSTLSGFNYNFGTGPSASQSFNVSGFNLTGNIVITPPTNYQISLASGSGYTSSLTLTQSGGNVALTPIYVRLITALVVNTYSGNVVLTSSFAGTQNVFCSGSVTAPIVTVSTFNLAGFIYTFGSGPSAYQSVSVIGSNLTNNIIATAPAGFEISTDKITYNSTITLTQSGGSVSSTKIYVRLISGLGVGTYGPLNLSFASTGSITQNVICSGKVVNSPTLISSVAALNGFMYLSGSGPSSSQTFTISGASLGVDITLAPPTNFEISKDFGITYTTGSLTITKPVSGLINPTLIYVRLISGKSPGTYSGNLNITSSGATSVSIVISGQVLTVPTITSGATPGTSVCIGNTVTLNSTPSGGIPNVIWTGPNGYYSQLINPPVPITGGTVSAIDAGIYTVTGSVLSGINLLTNGDFESGIGGFGSSYTYVVPSTNALGPEGVYTIIGDAPYTVPNNVHGNDNGFGNCDDHTHLTVPAAKHQMVINGNVTAGVIVWSESVSVQTGSDYQFSYYVQSVNSAAPSVLQLYVNGVPAGPMYTASSTTCTWTKFIYNTNSDINTVLQLTLINQNTAAGGNDFALDDLVFQQVFQFQSSVNLVVNPVSAPTLTVTASGNPVYTNTPVTFTATPTNGGTTPTYQWSVAGIAVPGAIGSTYTYIPTTGQVVSCVMTSSLPCATPSTATNQLTMTVNQRSNYWLGSAGANGTDWGTPANWTAGSIPAPGNDVEYATTGNAAGKMAVNNLQLDQDRTIGSLINASSQSLIIPAGNGLIVNQMITTNNDPGLINIKSSPLSKNGSLIYHNPTDKPVFATVEMYSLASYNPAGPVDGKYKWQYFGIPLSSVVANPTFYGSYVRSWDETGTSISNHWVSLNNNSTLLPFQGYEITQKNATTIVFQGQLVNSDSNFGPLTVTPTALYPGEHIYANPYTAAIDIKQLNFGSDTEATVYLYNTGSYNDWLPNGQSSPGTNPGQYTAVPKSTAGNGGLPRQIPSMQGFLIKAVTATSTADCTFGITYNSVVMNNSDAQRAPGIYTTTDDDIASTLIDLKGTSYGDRMWLFTQPGCTPDFDNGWDGRKMTGDALTPQIFAIEPDGNYQVNAVNDINNTILGFQAGADAEYTMTFTHTKIATKYSALFLVDLVENKTIDITQNGTTYSFISEPTPAPVKRFMIATRDIEKNAPDADTQLKVFSSGHVVFVQNLSNLNGEMIVYDIMGNMLKRSAFGPFGVTDIQLDAIPGAYIVYATTGNERVSKRVIIGD